jgi:hypothetical protein
VVSGRKRAVMRWSRQRKEESGDEVEGWTMRRAVTSWSGQGSNTTRRLNDDEEQRNDNVVKRTGRDGACGSGKIGWSTMRGIDGAATPGVRRWGETAPGKRGG